MIRHKHIKIERNTSMAKGNGHDMHEDEILSDVEMLYALAKIKQFKDMVQLLPIKTYSQADYYDAVDAIFDDIFTNPLTKKEKQ